MTIFYLFLNTIHFNKSKIFMVPETAKFNTKFNKHIYHLLVFYKRKKKTSLWHSSALTVWLFFVCFFSKTQINKNNPTRSQSLESMKKRT